MEQEIAKIEKWAKDGEQFIVPAWEELPAIPLYMDQVMLVLKDALSFFQENGEGKMLTSAMINNYVKNQVMPRPDKKKYSRDHLALMLVICMLKQVLSLQEIGTLIRQQPPQQLYDTFSQLFSKAVQETSGCLQQRMEAGEDAAALALQLAAEASAKQAAAQRILQSLEKTEEKEKGKK